MDNLFVVRPKDPRARLSWAHLAHRQPPLLLDGYVALSRVVSRQKRGGLPTDGFEMYDIAFRRLAGQRNTCGASSWHRGGRPSSKKGATPAARLWLVGAETRYDRRGGHPQAQQEVLDVWRVHRMLDIRRDDAASGAVLQRVPLKGQKNLAKT
eukprot:gene1752-1074_t